MTKCGAFEEIREDEYAVAHEAAQLGLLLINKLEDHAHLRDAQVGYLFRDDEVTEKGKVVFASCHLPRLQGAGAKYFGRFLEWNLCRILGFQPDFVILIDRNIWAGLDARQKLALIDHELCFPADVEVTGPKVERSFIRKYSGKMVEIRTAAGHLLTGTPNHPVLTNRGWRALELLREGDYVLSSRDPERVAIAMDPDEHQVPARIEQVARAARLATVPLRDRLVPEAAEDFDSQATAGEVDVVLPDRRLLADLSHAEILQHVAEHDLPVRDRVQVTLARLGGLAEGFFGVLLPAPLAVSGSQPGIQLRPFVGARKSQALRGVVVADRDAALGQNPLQNRIADAEDFAERAQRCPGGVAPDKIVAVREIELYEGHVYNLQTSQAWYAANGIIAHNCHAAQATDAFGEPRYNQQTGAPIWEIRGHDVEEFSAVVQRHGCWSPDLVEFARAVIESLNHGPTLELPSEVRAEAAR